MSEVIQRRKLFHEVADRLQETILSGVLQVGDMLPAERDPMERFGVGRSATREALLAWSAAGWSQSTAVGVRVSPGHRHAA